MLSTSLAVGNTGLSAQEQTGTKLPSGQLHKVYINSHPAQSIDIVLDAFFVCVFVFFHKDAALLRFYYGMR
ncbi:MAG: hypothetical protein KAI71_06835 [Candidatus Pacebacteria bacterium]|nr:hypothetical protein [Candidatus Paceibacterota bacterium]